MELDSIFREIVNELDAFDETREKIMVLGRKGVRSCSEAIKKLHRRDKWPIEHTRGLMAKAADIGLPKSLPMDVVKKASAVFKRSIESVDLRYRNLRHAMGMKGAPHASKMDRAVAEEYKRSKRSFVKKWRRIVP